MTTRWKVIGTRFGVPAVTFVNAASAAEATAEALRESGPGFDAVKRVEPDEFLRIVPKEGNDE